MRADAPPAPPWGDDDDTPPPASHEAEQAVLGALLLDNACLGLVSDLVDERSFWWHPHKLVYGAIAALVGAQQPADLITVFEALRQRELAEAAGGLQYLNEMSASVASSANVRRYAQIVADLYAERELIAATTEVRRISRDASVPFDGRMERIASVLARAEALRKGVGARVPMLGLQALRSASERIRWAVKHVLPAASVGMMFGGSGTFKSFIALDAALHVAHGLQWMGRKTRQAPVLYVAAEGGAGLWGRVDAWHRARPNQRWQDAPLYVVPSAVDLTVDAWRVVDAAQALGVCPGLVVVDTLSQTYVGEENSANEMAAYLREIGLRFRELWQCAVLLVHHTGHQATERPRGTSAIRANVDYMLGVFRDEKEMLATVQCVKQKDGELFADATFQMMSMQLGEDDDGEAVSSLVAWHLSSKEEVERAQAAERAAGRGGRAMAFMDLVQNGEDERGLRKSFYELLGDMDAESKRRAYGRARAKAVEQGLIEIAEGVVMDLRKGKA